MTDPALFLSGGHPQADRRPNSLARPFLQVSRDNEGPGSLSSFSRTTAVHPVFSERKYRHGVAGNSDTAFPTGDLAEVLCERGQSLYLSFLSGSQEPREGAQTRGAGWEGQFCCRIRRKCLKCSTTAQILQRAETWREVMWGGVSVPPGGNCCRWHFWLDMGNQVDVMLFAGCSLVSGGLKGACTCLSYAVSAELLQSS